MRQLEAQSAAAACAAGGAAYIAALALGQCLMLRLGVTTATRVVGLPLVPALCGAGTVSVASTLSLRAADAASSRLSTRRARPLHEVGSTFATAAIGLVLFRLTSGRFWALSPSCVTGLGAFSRTKGGSIAASLAYATTAERKLIQQLGRKFGCHSCGVRSVGIRFNADHMPPLAEVKRSNAHLWRRALGATVRQRFYPQCTTCSGQQAAILSRAARGLDSAGPAVVHVSSLRPYHAGGVLLTALALAAEGGAAAAREVFAAVERGIEAAACAADTFVARASREALQARRPRR